MTKRYALPGTVSEGTLRPEDLIPAFADALESLAKQAGNMTPELLALIEDARQPDCWPSDDPSLIFELEDALQEYAPPLFYFGAHEGDGACFGFWPSSFALEDFDGERISDLADLPADYTGEALLVNDHGNVSFYDCEGGKVRLVWSIV